MIHSWPSEVIKLSVLAEVMKQWGHKGTELTDIYPVSKHVLGYSVSFKSDWETMLGSDVK